MAVCGGVAGDRETIPGLDLTDGLAKEDKSKAAARDTDDKKTDGKRKSCGSGSGKEDDDSKEGANKKKKTDGENKSAVFHDPQDEKIGESAVGRGGAGWGGRGGRGWGVGMDRGRGCVSVERGQSKLDVVKDKSSDEN
ncbi:hypothetical protein E2C01_008810 [Portunus trituberculatus]|uniref:Uncharacterized protein n=1 Tax=Portunus trituberculatus TaxID=210409 RepID=A0A5B7D1S6_PORTR|nr:hypothetical protein [Portunus trituberculatus]